MRALIPIVLLIGLLATGCNGEIIERVRSANDDPVITPVAETQRQGSDERPNNRISGSSINGLPLTYDDLDRIEAAYGLAIDPGDYWYDPLSGAWGTGEDQRRVFSARRWTSVTLRAMHPLAEPASY